MNLILIRSLRVKMNKYNSYKLLVIIVKSNIKILIWWDRRRRMLKWEEDGLMMSLFKSVMN